MGEEKYLRGFPICPGISIGRPFLFTAHEEKVPEFKVPDHKIDSEIARYYRALKESRTDLVQLRSRLTQEGGQEAAAILSTHLEMMHDPYMTVRVEEAIREKGKNTEYVFKTVIGEWEKKFSKISDQLFRERLKDFQDISRRIIAHLCKKERCSLAKITSKVIIFAHELAPSDTAEASSACIEAFVTRSGSETSHVAIMARSRGIPFVSNVDFPRFEGSLPSRVIVDGRRGEVILDPSKKTLATFRQERRKQNVFVQGLKNARFHEAETIDGYKPRLSANIEMFGELDALEQYGGEGIGLFRTEYLFLAKDSFPTEEEQFLVYKNMVEKLDGHSAVIRTFDIGGDKFGDFYPTRYEKNPYLGCRAIRLMLKEKAAFKTQIRAILRASAFGEVSILFPMISGLAELREASSLVEEGKKELRSQGIPFTRTLKIGCMIEVPSAAITCDILAKECDFLSIGTNDLVQYALAVDRGNPQMSYLYTPTHPSIIRLIKMVVEEGCRAKTPVSVCGEIAADPKFTALLLGLGVHELSVSAPALPLVKNVLRHLCLIEAKELADHILSLSTAEEIHTALITAYQNLQL